VLQLGASAETLTAIFPEARSRLSRKILTFSCILHVFSKKMTLAYVSDVGNARLFTESVSSGVWATVSCGARCPHTSGDTRPTTVGPHNVSDCRQYLTKTDNHVGKAVPLRHAAAHLQRWRGFIGSRIKIEDSSGILNEAHAAAVTRLRC
jgi:hypothetical protein